MKTNCDFCGKEFNKKPSHLHKTNFCSRECYDNYHSVTCECDYCGKKLKMNKYKFDRAKHHFCDRKCQGKFRSKFYCGENSFNYKDSINAYICKECGKEFFSYHKNRIYCSIECKSNSQKDRVTLVCDYCGNEFERCNSEVKWHDLRGYKKIFCSSKCSYEYYSGENSPNWIEDRSQLKDQNKSIRWSKNMIKWRKSVYERDNYTCQICGRYGVELNAHHIKQFAKYPKLRFDVDNGITLCVNCHKQIHCM